MDSTTKKPFRGPCADGRANAAAERIVYQIDDGILAVSDQHIQALAERNVRFERRVCRTEDDIITRCADAAGVITMVEPVTRRVIEALPNLKVVARAGVGVDSVDVVAATECGVQVTNVPDGNYREVAVHALALILNAVRRIKVFDEHVHSGHWQPLTQGRSMRRPQTQTLGIVGFGRSGAELARLGRAAGFTVVAHSRPAQEDLVRRSGVVPVTLRGLLATADVISLHVPLTAQTRHLIDHTALAQMKDGAILINVSRGELIDEQALVHALRSGHLGGAALDVFAVEPLSGDSELLGLPNVVLTPHIAYLSADSLEETAGKALTEVLDVLEGRRPRYPVNQPLLNTSPRKEHAS